MSAANSTESSTPALVRHRTQFGRWCLGNGERAGPSAARRRLDEVLRLGWTAGSQ